MTKWKQMEMKIAALQKEHVLKELREFVLHHQQEEFADADCQQLKSVQKDLPIDLGLNDKFLTQSCWSQGSVIPELLQCPLNEARTRSSLVDVSGQLGLHPMHLFHLEPDIEISRGQKKFQSISVTRKVVSFYLLHSIRLSCTQMICK